MIVNLSVDVDSIELMKLAQEMGVQYIDTVVEPWPGFYFGSTLPNAERTNYPLREKVRALGKSYLGGATAVSCCGANPGMVSWLLKEALLRLAADTGLAADPKTRADWAALMQRLGVKGIHVAERDTQVAVRAKPVGVFVNTWSVDGLLSEGYQPAELGWGTHEKKLPPHGHAFDHGPGYAIWIDRPGADTRVRSWCPDVGRSSAMSSPTTRRCRSGLLHGLGRRPRRLSPDLPLCLSPLQRRGAVAARNERGREAPVRPAHPDGR